MIAINDQLREYMKKYDWQHIVLYVERHTSWCAPPYWEVLVSFTDKDEAVMLADGYAVEESELGKIYYPAKGLSFKEDAGQVNTFRHFIITGAAGQKQYHTFPSVHNK